MIPGGAGRDYRSLMSARGESWVAADPSGGLRSSLAGQLAIEASHDVRNLAQGILGCAELLLRRLEHPEERRLVERILTGAEAVGLTAERMLQVGRPGRRAVEPLDLPDLLAEAFDLVEARLRRAGVFVVERVAPDTPLVRASRDELRPVLLCVLLNACDALDEAPRERRRLELEVDRAPDGGARVVIRDTGPGFPPEVLARLGEPWVSTKSGGTGLGLATSFEVLRALEGRLEVESPPGGPTSVSITLPDA